MNKFRKWLASKIEPPTAIKFYVDELRYESGICTFHYKKERGIIKVIDKFKK